MNPKHPGDIWQGIEESEQTSIQKILKDIAKAYASEKWDKTKESFVNGWNNPKGVVETIAQAISEFSKGFAEAPINILMEGKEIGKNIIEYSEKPLGLKALEVIATFEKLSKFNKQNDLAEKINIIGTIGWKIAQEMTQLPSTPEESGKALAEWTIGATMPRVLKGVKTFRKVIDETTDFSKRDFGLGVTDEVCPKKTELFDKSHIKIDIEDLTHPSTPVGHKQREINVASGTNSRTLIFGREYSGHALDRMQERGLTPTMVEHVIEKGIQSPGNKPNRVSNYDPINKVTVVTEYSKVITVIFGGSKK